MVLRSVRFVGSLRWASAYGRTRIAIQAFWAKFFWPQIFFHIIWQLFHFMHHPRKTTPLNSYNSDPGIFGPNPGLPGTFWQPWRTWQPWRGSKWVHRIDPPHIVGGRFYNFFTYLERFGRNRRKTRKS